MRWEEWQVRPSWESSKCRRLHLPRQGRRCKKGPKRIQTSIGIQPDQRNICSESTGQNNTMSEQRHGPSQLVPLIESAGTTMHSSSTACAVGVPHPMHARTRHNRDISIATSKRHLTYLLSHRAAALLPRGLGCPAHLAKAGTSTRPTNRRRRRRHSPRGSRLGCA